jgi:hypothetical protein
MCDLYKASGRLHKKKDQKPRPLGEVLQEFQGKVIKAAKKLQLELSDSAEQPVSNTVEQSAPMDAADSVNLYEDPVFAELRARQKKRAQSSAAEELVQAEEQRPLAKHKAAKRHVKRTTGTGEQPASERQDRRLKVVMQPMDSAARPALPQVAPVPGSDAQSHQPAGKQSEQAKSHTSFAQPMSAKTQRTIPQVSTEAEANSSAARPASPTSSIGSTSRRQGATAEPGSVQECDEWLKSLPPQHLSQSRPLQRLQLTTSILQIHSSRKQREEIQQHLHAWDVPQKTQGRKRKWGAIKAHLDANVIEEACRLKRIQDASEAFSAIRTAFQSGST